MFANGVFPCDCRAEHRPDRRSRPVLVKIGVTPIAIVVFAEFISEKLRHPVQLNRTIERRDLGRKKGKQIR